MTLLMKIPDTLPPLFSIERFVSITEKELENVISSRAPANTKKCTTCDYSLRLEWCKTRGIIENIMLMDESNWTSLLAHFIQEGRTKDGSEYPLGYLNSIVRAIQRYMRDIWCPAINFYDASFLHATKKSQC